jgi:photosystem II stability/assembly factor-like uncharacterized protein
MVKKAQRSDQSRLWLIDGRAGPSNSPSYEARIAAGAATAPFGTPTTVRAPDPSSYGSFIAIDQIPGETGDPTIDTTGYYDPGAVSKMLEIGRGGCQADLQIHMGACEDPQDFNQGWSKVLVLKGARPTQWGTDALGALEPGDRAPVIETVPWQGEDIYELVHLTYAEGAATILDLEVIAIEVCDPKTCGECGLSTSGCDHVLATALAGAASPGILAQVIYSSDGGGTWADTIISTLAAAEDPSDATCVSPNYVVVSNDSDSLHFAAVADILAGTDVWTEVATGFVAAGSPNAIVSANSRATFIAGDLGYVYKTENPENGVTVLTDGSVTAQNLTDIDALDDQAIVAVGEANAVIFSVDGETFAAVTGPAPAVVLNAVAMKSEDEWWVGTADGRLYYTLDQGSNWTESSFSGAGAGEVRAIIWKDETVGYFSHDTVDPAGRIFRTIDGGFSWDRDGRDSLPANDQVTALAVCEDQNKVFGGGLGDDGSDGIIIKGSGS